MLLLSYQNFYDLLFIYFTKLEQMRLYFKGLCFKTLYGIWWESGDLA